MDLFNLFKSYSTSCSQRCVVVSHDYFLNDKVRVIVRYIVNTHTRTHTHTHTQHTHTQRAHTHTHTHNTTHTYTYAHTHIHIHTYAHTFIEHKLLVEWVVQWIQIVTKSNLTGYHSANEGHVIFSLHYPQTDWQLHGLFFDAIVTIASYVGWQGVSMLRPLLVILHISYYIHVQRNWKCSIL